MSDLLWITVPGGTDGEGRFVRVLVVPRLDGGTVAASGMDVWPPPGLTGDGLVAEWRDADGGAPTAEPLRNEDLRFVDHVPGLWARAVRTGAAVAGTAPQPYAPFEVQPTSTLAGDIAATYADPAAAAFTADQPALPDGYDGLVAGRLERWQTPPPPPPPPDARGADPPPPGFDRMMSLLREHPAVLRALGLIFEVRVTPPAGLADAGQVRITWPGGAPELPAVAPWTVYDAGFRPASPSGRFSAGMVTLTPDPAVPAGPRTGGWAVATMDVEGGAKRLREAAQILAGGRAVDARVPVSLPAMRTAGLQLMRVGRKRDLDDARAAAAANAARATGDQVLTAEQLVLGYRIDVRRGGGDWRSLHARIAEYDVGGVRLGTAAQPLALSEEGHVKANAASRRPDGSIDADETVARWDGWSLSVPRPRFDGTTRRGRRRGAELPIDLDFRFHVDPGSLPALRFTADYALRARVVDMAGGGLERLDPAADRCALVVDSYGRYEPVPSPDVLLPAGVAAADLGPGEAADHLVIRSAPGVSVDDFPAANPRHPLNAGRRLTRPVASLDLAEQHGMLDGVDDQQAFAWVQRALAASALVLEGAPPAADQLPDPAAGGIQVVPLPSPASPPAAFARRDWRTRWPEPEDPKTLVLRDRAAGQQPLAWEGETLVVRLAPSEQLTLEVSSTLTEDMWDHFALRNEATKPAAVRGRNPLITPSRRLTLVHAVRRPMWEPRDTLRVDPLVREPGQTFAVLDPGPPEVMNLHARSTAQVDLSARWEEQRDEPAPRAVEAAVQTILVDPGDAALRKPLRQEFHDTRHRLVTYTLTAVTRFRRHFLPLPENGPAPPRRPPPPPPDPEPFVVRRTLPAVHVLNTGVPTAPVVPSVRPAFAWQEEVTGEPGATTVRRVRGGRLRVELARPWYETGVGERLGVVLWDRSAAAPPPEVRGLVSQAGRDPVWGTPDPERWPATAAFAGATGPAVATRLAENAAAVQVVPYEAWLEGDRWYADVSIPGLAASSYCPFVELAVVRFQPDSIPGHDMSPVVRAEPAQLLPDRTLTVRRSAGAVTVRLEGTGPGSPAENRVHIVLEAFDGPPGAADPPDRDGLTALGAGAAGAPAWRTMPGTERMAALGAEVVIALPSSAGAVRARVREVEVVAGTPPPGIGTPVELAERVVFTDAVVTTAP